MTRRARSVLLVLLATILLTACNEELLAIDDPSPSTAYTVEAGKTLSISIGQLGANDRARSDGKDTITAGGDTYAIEPGAVVRTSEHGVKLVIDGSVVLYRPPANFAYDSDSFEYEHCADIPFSVGGVGGFTSRECGRATVHIKVTGGLPDKIRQLGGGTPTGPPPSSTTVPAPTTTTSTTTPPPPPPGPTAVTLQALLNQWVPPFVPGALSYGSDQVDFEITNADASAHTFTIDVDGDTVIDTSTGDIDEPIPASTVTTFTVTLPPGMYTFSSTPDPGMVGTIIVS